MLVIKAIKEDFQDSHYTSARLTTQDKFEQAYGRVDGNRYYSVTPASLPAGKKWVFDHPFFILLNLAIGGNGPGSTGKLT